jgi:PAS domain S-box-containing protein
MIREGRGVAAVQDAVISAVAEELLDAGPDGLVIIDGTGRIRFVNCQAEALFGYRRDEVVGQLLEVLLPDHARAVHTRHRASYSADPAPRSMAEGLDPTARRKDGTLFPIGISLSSLQTDQGVFVSAAVRDITDRQRMEGERGKREAKLIGDKRDEEQRIEGERGKREAKLIGEKRDEEQALLEAQLHQAQRLESIGQLAGGVAHDFNNLLAGIMNYAHLVSTSLHEEVSRRNLSDVEAFVTIGQDVDEITKVAKRAAMLTRQLLIFSRRTVVQPEVLDLNAVVTEMQTLLRTTIGEHVDLQGTFAPDLPLIKADRGQMDQVFMNLAVNARDAMPGGGELKIETARFDVDARYARLHSITPGIYVRLTVSDTGTGMTPEVAARSFEPFFTTKAIEGSGLGLATVYGIVTQAGGDIAIDSELGLGTTVRITLPATSDATTEPRSARPNVPLSARGETVLLVEDEAIVREPAGRMLTRHGYTVLSAANAEEALVIVREHPGRIDLLLTDVVMPGRSGKELSLDIAELRPTTKVLFMSGYSQDVIAHQGVLEEGVQLIEKPFTGDDLLRKVRDVLEGAS